MIDTKETKEQDKEGIENFNSSDIYSKEETQTEIGSKNLKVTTFKDNIITVKSLLYLYLGFKQQLLVDFLEYWLASSYFKFEFIWNDTIYSPE